MDEVVEALEKYKGLVPLVYDVETMGLEEARPQDMQYAVYLKREADKVIAEKDKEIRRLRRALWLARAERADDKARIFYFAETCGVDLNINGYSNKEKGCTRKRTAHLWMLTWLKIERKCRAKAEEYK